MTVEECCRQFELKVDRLVFLAKEFARIKNFDEESYLSGLIDPLIFSGADDLDFDKIVSYLIAYHEEWIKKNG